MDLVVEMDIITQCRMSGTQKYKKFKSWSDFSRYSQQSKMKLAKVDELADTKGFLLSYIVYITDQNAEVFKLPEEN